MRLLFGIAAGIVTGLLLAPKSGKENMEDLKRESNKFRADAENKLNQLLAQGREQYNKILSDLKVSQKDKNDASTPSGDTASIKTVYEN